MTTALEAVERASGATFAQLADAALPARFGDLRSEWAAVRQRCGLIDAGFRGLLRLIGSDRLTFLQGMVSNDVARLHDGEGTYAALLTTQGKIVADLRVYMLTDEIWLDVPATRQTAVREALERFIVADDVEFVHDATWKPLVAVEGPLAARTLLGVTGETLDSLPLFAHRAITIEGQHARVVAVSHAGEIGYLMYGPPDLAPVVWERCRAAGAEPVGMEALNVLRLEAGIAWHGHDMDESTLISEAGLDTAISYTKGCYLGQEVVERVAARGQVHRKLVGMVVDGQSVPTAGAALMHDGKEVGRVTSAAWSPACERVIALGYVRRECWEPGSLMEVSDGEVHLAARVVALPFYARA